MEAFFNLLSSYEFFNNLFPGIIFSYFFILQENNFFKNNIELYEKLFIYYFIGLIINRIGSLLLEPTLKKLKIIEFADYLKFLEAEKMDNKITMLLLVNNMYRSFVVVFLLCFFWLIFKNKFLLCTSSLEPLIILFLLLLFFYSYKKQTEYIRQRVEKNLKLNRRN
ncbi:hypothetical protein JMUB4039_1690 [Leptotrichia trevisanii]|uniref:hypothetical protein n=1 Tax=Leptotrichia trevisanii TaxID=109328 RepID=UPI00118D0B86|nr:hypothetical protein [Leptotrichia trevisanii]BBM57710.1 hypothetical protein JMUB4039_1690 [Leptotrichia trevisanii]